MFYLQAWIWAAAAVMLVAKPAVLATEAPVAERSLVLSANGQNIPAVLSLPERGAAAWRVVLIPGSFANDMDGNYSPTQGSPFAAKPHMYKD